MDVTINIFGIGGIVVLAILIGYFIGRSERRVMAVDEEPAQEQEHSTGRHRPNSNRNNLQGRSIAGPVAGRVEYFAEGGRKGVVIEPEQGLIYAPVSGKIIRLYPMGNAFILRSHERENPIELLIRVGREQPDELCSMYFRSRIVQNEIVNKGKLLLEFDKESLLAAGEDVAVTVCPVAGAEENDIVVTRDEQVKVGEEIFKIL